MLILQSEPLKSGKTLKIHLCFSFSPPPPPEHCPRPSNTSLRKWLSNIFFKKNNNRSLTYFYFLPLLSFYFYINFIRPKNMNFTGGKGGKEISCFICLLSLRLSFFFLLINGKTRKVKKEFESPLSSHSKSRSKIIILSASSSLCTLFFPRSSLSLSIASYIFPVIFVTFNAKKLFSDIAFVTYH